MSTAGRAEADYSKGNSGSWADSGAHPAVRAALVGVAAIGALLLIVSDFQTLYSITVGTVVKKTVVGHSQHSFALLLIGLAALALTAASVVGSRSRAAMAAVALLGLVALLIALIGDLPDVNSTGLIGQLYAEASASAKIGFYMETLGAVALIFSGVSMLFLSSSPVKPGRVRRSRAGTRERARPGSGAGPVDAEDAGWL
jgi:hypothetical protein